MSRRIVWSDVLGRNRPHGQFGASALCTPYTRLMADAEIETARPRTPLNRERVLRTAIELADRQGVDGLSMRRLSAELGVVPMALYKHVANKDELLDAMINAIVAEIDPPRTDIDWKTAVRERILSARRMLLRHPWASRVMESRTRPTPNVMAYMDSMIAMFTAGGFSIDLVHHVMHAMGSRLMGFTQEMFNDRTDEEQPFRPEMLEQLRQVYPSIYSLYLTVNHEDTSIVGSGCDDQFEFEFALDLMLDGIERLKKRTPKTPAHR
jgi:AcrR family transcriptional regulator